MTLFMNGHPVDKIELLVLGGTWASYPHEYQESYVRDLFYAANTFYQAKGGDYERARGSLEEEKKMNETARVKIIGLTLETRPDCITPREIRRFRRYGCTRVQLGVQHTDFQVLKKINRACYTPDVVRAVKLLKDCCNSPLPTSISVFNNPKIDPWISISIYIYIYIYTQSLITLLITHPTNSPSALIWW